MDSVNGKEIDDVIEEVINDISEEEGNDTLEHVGYAEGQRSKFIEIYHKNHTSSFFYGVYYVAIVILTLLDAIFIGEPFVNLYRNDLSGELDTLSVFLILSKAAIGVTLGVALHIFMHNMENKMDVSFKMAYNIIVSIATLSGIVLIGYILYGLGSAGVISIITQAEQIINGDNTLQQSIFAPQKETDQTLEEWQAGISQLRFMPLIVSFTIAFLLASLQKKLNDEKTARIAVSEVNKADERIQTQAEHLLLRVRYHAIKEILEKNWIGGFIYNELHHQNLIGRNKTARAVFNDKYNFNFSDDPATANIQNIDILLEHFLPEDQIKSLKAARK